MNNLQSTIEIIIGILLGAGLSWAQPKIVDKVKIHLAYRKTMKEIAELENNLEITEFREAVEFEEVVEIALTELYLIDPMLIVELKSVDGDSIQYDTLLKMLSVNGLYHDKAKLICSTIALINALDERCGMNMAYRSTYYKIRLFAIEEDCFKEFERLVELELTNDVNSLQEMLMASEDLSEDIPVYDLIEENGSLDDAMMKYANVDFKEKDNTITDVISKLYSVNVDAVLGLGKADIQDMPEKLIELLSDNELLIEVELFKLHVLTTDFTAMEVMMDLAQFVVGKGYFYCDVFDTEGGIIPVDSSDIPF